MMMMNETVQRLVARFQSHYLQPIKSDLNNSRRNLWRGTDPPLANTSYYLENFYSGMKY